MQALFGNSLCPAQERALSTYRWKVQCLCSMYNKPWGLYFVLSSTVPRLGKTELELLEHRARAWKTHVLLPAQSLTSAPALFIGKTS